MAELDAIVDSLRRQRRDLDELLDQTLSRTAETAELVRKAEVLRRHAEETLQRLQSGDERPERSERS